MPVDFEGFSRAFKAWTYWHPPLRAGQMRLVGEPVERRAQATDHIHDLVWLGFEAAGDGNGIVAPHHGSEIPRRGELVMQPAIGNQIGLAVAILAVDDACQVNSCFANEITAEFDEKFSL